MAQFLDQELTFAHSLIILVSSDSCCKTHDLCPEFSHSKTTLFISIRYSSVSARWFWTKVSPNFPQNFNSHFSVLKTAAHSSLPLQPSSLLAQLLSFSGPRALQDELCKPCRRRIRLHFGFCTPFQNRCSFSR